jgi:hypothetical protein
MVEPATISIEEITTEGAADRSASRPSISGIARTAETDKPKGSTSAAKAAWLVVSGRRPARCPPVSWNSRAG